MYNKVEDKQKYLLKKLAEKLKYCQFETKFIKTPTCL